MRLEDIQADIAVRTESLPLGTYEFFAAFVPHCGWMELDTAQEWDSHSGPKSKLNVFKYEDSPIYFPAEHADAHIRAYNMHFAAKRRQATQRRAKRQDEEFREFRRWKRSRKKVM